MIAPTRLRAVDKRRDVVRMTVGATAAAQVERPARSNDRKEGKVPPGWLEL